MTDTGIDRSHDHENVLTNTSIVRIEFNGVGIATRGMPGRMEEDEVLMCHDPGSPGGWQTMLGVAGAVYLN